MDNSIYVALSRQVALFRDLEVTANNLANVNTNGFGGQQLLQTPFVVDAGHSQKVAFENPVDTFRRLEPGTVRTTGNPLDASILGPGYFTVETPLGNRYTKNGNFQLDANGTLVNGAGYPVLDDTGGRITFETDDGNVVIGSNGNISVNGEERATLGIATFENQQAMEPVGEGLYKADVPAIPNPQDGSITVSQGTLEQSNVEPVTQLTHLVDVSRSLSMTQNLINGLYDLEQRTSRTLTQQS
jgi:flagellar basal-body rod protein FlgF